MSSEKISHMPTGAPQPQGLIPIVQFGTNYATTAQEIADLAGTLTVCNETDCFNDVNTIQVFTTSGLSLEDGGGGEVNLTLSNIPINDSAIQFSDFDGVITNTVAV
jgi:hypothetical protein